MINGRTGKGIERIKWGKGGKEKKRKKQWFSSFLAAVKYIVKL